MLINDECKKCQIEHNINSYPKDASKDKISEYQSKVMDIINNSNGFSTPQVVEKIDTVYLDVFGTIKDYSEIKEHFNSLMLSLMPYMEEHVETAKDQLKMAVQYSMVGNYIDFGAFDNVDENKLREQLDDAFNIDIDAKMLENFRNEITNSKRLVFFTDNCGEIVTDKLLIKVIKKVKPNLAVTVIVRGKPVVNDATLEDAKQVGMEEVADYILDNGTGMPGNVIGAVSEECMEAIKNADVLISKGQGNYEGLSGCGLNVFYFFLCKCELFMKRFGVPRYTGIVTREIG